MLLKVVHVIAGLGRGGAEGALYRLCEANGIDEFVVVSLSSEGVYGPRLRNRGVAVATLGLRSLMLAPMAFIRLRRLLRNARPDVVQTWMYHADLLGGLAARSLGIPVCWGIRQSDVSLAANKLMTVLVIRLCALLSRWVPKVVVSCSVRAVESHRAIGYKARFEIVHNGVDVVQWSDTRGSREQVRSALAVPRNAFLFVHAARGDPQKDHPTLARAFNALTARNSDVRLLLCGTDLQVGDSYFESLPFSQTARGLVIALGARDDLPLLWRAGDAFVLSSTGEAFPNVVAEAMASAMPCIVTNVGDSAAIVGDTGIVVPPSDPETLGHAMGEMMRLTEEDRVRLGKAAQARIASTFTLGRMAEGFSRVWVNAIEGRYNLCVD